VTTSSPHDALVRGVFSSPENAAGHIRAVLPDAISERIEWNSLRLEPGQYVEPDLTDQYSDLLYSVRLADHPALIFVLYEHQSTGDGMMALRLLRYMSAIWKRWLDDNEGAKLVPPIIPIVLSNAQGGWRWPTSMAELYDAPPDLHADLLPYLPSFRFALDDLMDRTDDELLARTATALGVLAVLALRHGRDEQGLAPRIASWAKLVAAVFSADNGREALGMLVRYAVLANQRTTIQDLADVLVPLLGEGAREVVMTEGERLIQQGEFRGRKEGRKEGETKGRAASVVAVLTARGIQVSNEYRTRIESCTDIPTLDRWIVRSATVSSVDEVFDGE